MVLSLLVSNPGIYIREIQRELNDGLMLDVSASTIYNVLHKSGFTHQRLGSVALQQYQLLREKFAVYISLNSTDMYVFIDETGADQRNTLRKYGYILRGKPATRESLLV